MPSISERFESLRNEYDGGTSWRLVESTHESTAVLGMGIGRRDLWDSFPLENSTRRDYVTRFLSMLQWAASSNLSVRMLPRPYNGTTEDEWPVLVSDQQYWDQSDPLLIQAFANINRDGVRHSAHYFGLCGSCDRMDFPMAPYYYQNEDNRGRWIEILLCPDCVQEVCPGCGQGRCEEGGAHGQCWSCRSQGSEYTPYSEGQDEPLNLPPREINGRTPQEYVPTECPSCGGEVSLEEARLRRNRDRVCQTCYERRCDECRAEDGIHRGPVDRLICDTCHSRLLSRDSSYIRAMNVEQDDLETTFDLDKYTFRARPHFRLFTTELEFNQGAEGGRPLCEALYTLGVSRHDNMASYHHGDSHSVRVESDGSVSGGELIIPFIDLKTAAGHAKLWTSFDAYRRRIKDGRLRLGSNCGNHIHVDASGLSVSDVARIIVLFNFLEDTFYRLGSANWAKHRGNSSRTANKWHSLRHKRQLVNSHSDRSYGINIAGWNQGRQFCTCAANNDDDHRCTCAPSVNRNTIEVRTMNATANPIKEAAYIALIQAVFAYAQEHEDVHPDDFPPHSYEANGIVPKDDARVYSRRLQFIFDDLDLNAQERNWVRYCVRNSDLRQLETHLEKWVWDRATVAEDDALPEPELPDQHLIPLGNMQMDDLTFVNIPRAARELMYAGIATRTSTTASPAVATWDGEGIEFVPEDDHEPEFEEADDGDEW